MQIQKNTLKAVSLLAAVRNARFYLNGVCVEVMPDGIVNLVATDGNALLAVAIPATMADAGGMLPGQYILPNDLVKAALKLKGQGGNEELTLSIDPNTKLATFVGIGGQAAAVCIDGRFPDYRRVLPAAGQECKSAAQLDAKYAMAMQDAAKLLGIKNDFPHFAHVDGTTSVRVTFPSRNALGVVMPVRIPDAYPAPTF